MPTSCRNALQVLLAALLFFSLSGAGFAAQTQNAPGNASAHTRVQTVAQALTATYDPATGLFRGTGWWNSANGITALANAGRTLHTAAYDSIFSNTLIAAQRKFPNFRNEFYDDEGWWALAWIDVYNLHHEPQYLRMAESIFDDMKGGWSDTCGGGIWWKKNEHYKNAIANELFLAVAVELATVHAGEARSTYLDWAQREKTWFLASGMLNDRSLVNDGLTAECKNNGRTTWTYNQGVILEGLAGLSQLTGDQAALAQASRIAEAANEHLTDSAGVLHDPCEPNCGADGIQFKGIFVRDLVPLLKAAPSPKLQTLLDRSANSAWTQAQTPGGQFACDWAGPPQDDKSGALISVLDLFTADLTNVPKRRGGFMHWFDMGKGR